MNLYQISEEIREIKKAFENGEAVDFETGEVNPEYVKALTFSKNELEAKAIDYGYVLKSFDDEIELYDKEIKRLTERKKQLQTIQKHIKENITNAMIEFDIVEIKGNLLKMNFRTSQSVEVYDLDLLDERFKRYKVEADKTAIKEALKNGEEVQGARLVENKNLQIK